VFAVEQPYTNP